MTSMFSFFDWARGGCFNNNFWCGFLFVQAIFEYEKMLEISQIFLVQKRCVSVYVWYLKTGRRNSSVVVCKWRSGAEYLCKSSSSLCTAAAQFCCCHLTAAAAAARSIKTDGESRSSETAG